MAIDFTGMVKGHLTVLNLAPSTVNKEYGLKHPRWECRCQCGKLIAVPERMLKKFPKLSCGCADGEYNSLAQGNATHRLTSTRTYKSWSRGIIDVIKHLGLQYKLTVN